MRIFLIFNHFLRERGLAIARPLSVSKKLQMSVLLLLLGDVQFDSMVPDILPPFLGQTAVGDNGMNLL